MVKYELSGYFDFLDFIFFAPEFFLFFSALTVFISMLFSDFYYSRVHADVFDQKKILRYDFSFSLALTIISTFLVFVAYLNSYPIMHTSYTLFNNLFYGYFFIFFFKVFLALIFLCYLISIPNFSNLNFGFEFSFLLSISFFSMQLLFSSYNLISLYLCLELQSFCFYILSASKKNSIFSSEAGLKFFILNSFSSVLILFGISVIYSVYGTFDLDVIASFLSFFRVSPLRLPFIFGFVFIICGFLFKLGIVPFHSWLPDVYDGSPFIVTFFFSVVTKLPTFIVFLYLTQIFFIPLNFGFSKVLAVFAILSIVVGSFSALFQTRLKRFLGYASISQFGFVLLTLTYAPKVSLEPFLFYIIIYTILNLTLFCCFFGFYNPDCGRNLSLITDLRTVYNYNRSLAIVMVVTLFSLAGIPPLAGFVSKYYLLYSLIATDEKIAILLFFIVLFSSVSVFYYLRLVAIIFLEPEAKKFVFNFKIKNLNLSKNSLFSSFISYFFAFILVHLVYFNIFFILCKHSLFVFILLLRVFFVCLLYYIRYNIVRL